MLDELSEDDDGVDGGERDEGVGLVRVSGATAGQVGESPDCDERKFVLVGNEGNRSAFHVHRADLEVAV